MRTVPLADTEIALEKSDFLSGLRKLSLIFRAVQMQELIDYKIQFFAKTCFVNSVHYSLLVFIQSDEAERCRKPQAERRNKGYQQKRDQDRCKIREQVLYDIFDLKTRHRAADKED